MNEVGISKIQCLKPPVIIILMLYKYMLFLKLNNIENTACKVMDSEHFSLLYYLPKRYFSSGLLP